MSKTIYLTKDGAVLSLLGCRLNVYLFGGIPFEDKQHGFAEYEICDKEEKGRQYAYLVISQDGKTAILFNDKPKYDEKTRSYSSDGFKVELRLETKSGFDEKQLKRLMILRSKDGC